MLHPDRRLISALLVALVATVVSTPASAQAQQSQEGASVENYRDSLLQHATSRARVSPDPSPEGKKINRIVVIPYDVIAFSDPLPELLNWFHSTTDRDVILRELLFAPGDRWSATIAEESERNLRSNLFLNIAEIRPMRGEKPDELIVLVATKDLWSLRTNWDFSFIGSTFEFAQLQLIEKNLAGRNKSFGLNLAYDLASTSFGEVYQDPRLFGSRVALNHSASIIINRGRGRTEGGNLLLEIGQPLFSLDTQWAWTVSADYSRDVFRLFSGGDLVEVPIASTGESVPYVFHREVTDFTVGVTRSFGRAVKNNLFFGWRGIIKQYDLPNPAIKSVQPASLDAFADARLPYSERIGMLSLSHHHFRTDFRELYDFESFNLSEDYRLGPDLIFGLNLASRYFGFESDYVLPTFEGEYTWLLGDNLLAVGLIARSRYQPQAPKASPWVNRHLSFGIKNISERFSIFRVAAGARFTLRADDLNRSQSALGSNISFGSNVAGYAVSALRGYPSNYFIGSRDWAANIELRTRPLVYQTVHLGGAAFVDAGDTWDPGESIGAHASVGIGARILFPQFNRAVVRVDLAMPLETLEDDPAYFTAEFGQAF